MYLYLIWKDRDSKDIYTSVFQTAAYPVRFTRSQPTFYHTVHGVSWTRNTLPGDSLQGIYTHDSLTRPFQLNGYGKY